MLHVLVKLMGKASIYNILFNILDFKAEFWQTFSKAGSFTVSYEARAIVALAPHEMGGMRMLEEPLRMRNC